MKMRTRIRIRTKSVRIHNTEKKYSDSDDDRAAWCGEDLLGGEVRQGEPRQELQHTRHQQSHRKDEGTLSFVCGHQFLHQIPSCVSFLGPDDLILCGNSCPCSALIWI